MCFWSRSARFVRSGLLQVLKLGFYWALNIYLSKTEKYKYSDVIIPFWKCLICFILFYCIYIYIFHSAPLIDCSFLSDVIWKTICNIISHLRGMALLWCLCSVHSSAWVTLLVCDWPLVHGKGRGLWGPSVNLSCAPFTLHSSECSVIERQGGVERAQPHS